MPVGFWWKVIYSKKHIKLKTKEKEKHVFMSNLWSPNNQ